MSVESGLARIEVPERMRFEALPNLSYAKFRRHRKIFRMDRGATIAQSGETRTISITAPANWYLLGHKSRINWTSVLTGGVDDPLSTDSQDLRRMKYGPYAPWARVRETTNSGSLVISQIDDQSASQAIGRFRSYATRRPITQLFRNVASNQVQDLNLQPEDSIINTLETSGCISTGYRKAGENLTPPGNLIFSGFNYSVPLTAYSRMAQNEYLPIGLMSNFNPASAFQLEFVVATANQAQCPVGGFSILATEHKVYDLECYAEFIEVLDSELQSAIEMQFNRETVQTPNGPVELKLRLPVLSLEHQVYSLLNGSKSAVISIQCNSPSLRAIALIPRNTNAGLVTASNDGTTDSDAVRWKAVNVMAGGYCIMDSPKEDDKEYQPAVLDSWLSQQRENANSLFSLYAPQLEAVMPLSASSFISFYSQVNNNNKSIVLDFENGDGELPDDMRALRGLDMRNIGRVDCMLTYEGQLVSNASQGLNGDVILDVLLVYDTLYQVGRDGVRDVSIYDM